MIPLVRHVMRQTRGRIFGGDTHSQGKLVSLFEPSTEVIRKGKAGKPTEFGKLVKLQEAENQIIVDYEVYARRPNDVDLLIPAIQAHHAALGRPPRLVAGDAAFYSTKNEAAARAMGVKRVCIPNRSTKSVERKREQKKRWFRDGQRWRTGSEGRQRDQAPTRPKALPLSRRRRHAPVGRAWRHRRQSHHIRQRQSPPAGGVERLCPQSPPDGPGALPRIAILTCCSSAKPTFAPESS